MKININVDEKEIVKNGYIAFYKEKKIEIFAETSYKAQLEAARLLNVKKSYEVTVVLAEKNGKAVIHKPLF